MKNNLDSRNKSQGAIPEPKPVFYEITIQGCLDSERSKWFDGMTLTPLDQGESERACTLITGFVIDQPALYGLLIKIRDLNLTLISVRQCTAGTTRVEPVPIKAEQPEDRDESTQ